MNQTVCTCSGINIAHGKNTVWFTIYTKGKAWVRDDTITTSAAEQGKQSQTVCVCVACDAI